MQQQDLFLIGAMVLLVAMFFFSSRRRKAAMKQQQEEKARDMVPGARVMLNSGIYGYIVSIDAEDLNAPVQLEIAPGTVIEVHSQAVARLAPLEDIEAIAADSVADAADEQLNDTQKRLGLSDDTDNNKK